MKKLIIGFAAIAAVLAVRPALKHKAREHCERMATKCKEKMAGSSSAGTRLAAGASTK